MQPLKQLYVLEIPILTAVTPVLLRLGFRWRANGQVEVNKILSSVFNVFLENVEFRKVIPSDYRLFQVADLVCTLVLTEMKMNAHNLSKSDIRFFKDERTLKKNYLKPLREKKLNLDHSK